MPRSRQALQERLHALVEDALDEIERRNPEGFDLGVVAIVSEVRTPSEPFPHLRRAAAGYTPEDDTTSGYFTYWCSDARAWVQRAVLGAAYDLAHDAGSDEDDDTEAQDDDGSNED